MKKFKIIKAAVVLFALLFAVTGVAYADNNTSKFTDIDNSWAKQHIINVCSKGLMGGSTATQFKPGDHIKNYDALVSISRMINRGNDINLEQLEETYQADVLDKYNVPEYAREGILVCLDSGIIADFEIETFSKYPYALKKDISKYMGKALGVVVEINAPPVVLGFKDTLMIHNSYKPYIKFLIDKGVINGNGDVYGKFSPNDFVDRAAFAKMLDISNSVYEKEKLGLDTTATNNSTGDTTVPDTNTGSEVTWPDTTVSTTPVIIEDGAKADVTAYVDEVIAEYGNLAVFVGTERRIYKVADNATCTIDEVSSGYWKLKKSDMVKLYLADDKVIKILGESKIRKTVGKLVGIQSADKTTLKIEVLTGGTKNYNITAKTIVIKDGKSALWQELKEGNTLVITTSYDELLEINADGVKSADKGVIESVVYSRMAPPKVVITALDGSQNTYYSNKSMEVIGAGSDAYSLRPGMQVNVSLVDDEISKIEVINVMSETATIEVVVYGQIKKIDAAAKLIVLEVHDKALNNYIEKRVFLENETRIGDAYLNILSVGNLKVGQFVDVRGTGSTEGIYAKVIQIK